MGGGLCPLLPSPSQHSVASTGHMGWCLCALGLEWEPLRSSNTLDTERGATQTVLPQWTERNTMETMPRGKI